jgi:hypothetical protein
MAELFIFKILGYIHSLLSDLVPKRDEERERTKQTLSGNWNLL